jgi:glutaredoxin
MKRFSIILVVLKGCSNCKRIKELLDTNNIIYNSVSCDDDCQVCDELDDITKNTLYPKIVVKDKVNNINNIIYQTNDSSELGIVKKIKNINLFPTFGDSNIITEINKLINK